MFCLDLLAESDTRNRVKPGVTQITSFKIAEGDMGDVYVGKAGGRTPASLVWGEIQVKTFAK